MQRLLAGALLIALLVGCGRDAPPNPEPTAAPDNSAGPDTPGVTAWVSVGEVRVKVQSVALGKLALLKTPRGGPPERIESTDARLAVRLRVENQSPKREITVGGWGATGDTAPTLTDDQGGKCAFRPQKYLDMKAGGIIMIEGDGNSAPFPKDAARFVTLPFDPPADGAKELKLRLPAGPVGEEGEFVFAIPASAWKK